jgi:branched-chain amino acid aminotransferase
MMLEPLVPLEQWLELARDGLARFDHDAALYIKPMYWAEQTGFLTVAPDPLSTRWCMTLYESPMPRPGGHAITLSPFRRPSMDVMPVDAKAACLYPNNARAAIEARSRGFDNCLLCDMLGNVAELANSNVFLAKDSVVFTPAPNGTFLNGITRQRVIGLLRNDGVTVVEKTLTYGEFTKADEIFSSGNYAKVFPVIRIDDRHLDPGPVYRRARELYWAFAHSK